MKSKMVVALIGGLLTLGLTGRIIAATHCGQIPANWTNNSCTGSGTCYYVQTDATIYCVGGFYKESCIDTTGKFWVTATEWQGTCTAGYCSIQSIYNQNTFLHTTTYGGPQCPP